MNDKYSTTEGKTSEKLSDEAMLSAQWKNIDWHKAEREVNRLQTRIVKATQQKDYNAVKRLQYLLTHSFYAKALAVKRVVTNDGRRTPGVDGVLWNTPAKKMAAALSLTDKRYRARPLRRVYMHFVELYHGEFSEERLLRALRNIHPVDIYRIGQDDPEKLRGWKKYVFPIYTAYNGKCRKDALPMKF